MLFILNSIDGFVVFAVLDSTESDGVTMVSVCILITGAAIGCTDVVPLIDCNCIDNVLDVLFDCTGISVCDALDCQDSVLLDCTGATGVMLALSVLVSKDSVLLAIHGTGVRDALAGPDCVDGVLLVLACTGNQVVLLDCVGVLIIAADSVGVGNAPKAADCIEFEDTVLHCVSVCVVSTESDAIDCTGVSVVPAVPDCVGLVPMIPECRNVEERLSKDCRDAVMLELDCK